MPIEAFHIDGFITKAVPDGEDDTWSKEDVDNFDEAFFDFLEKFGVVFGGGFGPIDSNGEPVDIEQLW